MRPATAGHRMRTRRQHTLSTESIASPSSSSLGATEPCAICGAPLAPDQRYCLQCGERRAPISAFLRGNEPGTSRAPNPTPTAPPPGALPATGARRNNNALTVIAGVGVLLLAMGVGVLIGRAGVSKQSQAPAEVITVGSTAGSGAATGAVEEAFTSDWPAETKGYTIQLEKLPLQGTSAKAVETAKTEASSKGAASVGALKSEDFTSLAAGSYIVYSGVYRKRSDAQNALGALKKKFPAAKVIEVSSSSKSSAAGNGTSGSGSGAGNSVNHPAPPSVLESLKGTKGKSYEEKSKALPDVVSTG